jgi:hypothetical protein
MLQYLDKQIRIRIISLTILLSGIFAVNTTSFAQCVSEGITATLVTNENCPKDLTVNGLVESTIQWNSIFPGAIGDYNANLSCANACSTTTFTPPSGIGNQVIFQASGISCSTGQPWTGQVTINVNPEIQINFSNSNPTICFGALSTLLSSVVSGGTPPYSYSWNGPGILSGQITNTISVNSPGIYFLEVLDQSGCPSAVNKAEVFQQLANPMVNAGPNQVICNTSNNTVILLNGSVQNSNGALWTGGAGVFNPSNQDTITSYTPSSVELQNGFVHLTLNSDQNGNCPIQSDDLFIYLSSSIQNQSNIVNPSCGQNNGSISLAISGGNNPYSFAWSSGQTTQNISNLSAGSYTVVVTDSVGCSEQFSFNLNNVGGPQTSGLVTNVQCPGQNSGAINLSVNGGTLPYTYSWSNGQSTEDIFNLTGGTFNVTVQDANGCISTNSFILNSPLPLNVQSTIGEVSCLGVDNGYINLSISGGTLNYNFSWSNNETTEDLIHLSPGIYSVIITDGNGCTTTQPYTVGLSASSLSLTETQPSVELNRITILGRIM